MNRPRTSSGAGARAASEDATEANFEHRTKHSDSAADSKSATGEPDKNASQATKASLMIPVRTMDSSRAKRKADASQQESPKKRLRKHLNVEYRDLFNSTVQDVVSHVGSDGAELLPTQVGASHWSPIEKQALFSQLGVSGRHNVLELARAINTKTEAEVQNYLGLLQNGVWEAELSYKAKHIFGLTDLPAAWELSSGCVTALDNAAEVLAWHQQRYDAQQEQKKFGNDWLIDEKATAKIERRIERQLRDINSDAQEEANVNDNEQAKSDAERNVLSAIDAALDPAGERSTITSAAILCPQNWLELSRHLFMNGPPESEDTWHRLAGPEDQGPSIYRTALDDFHNLTISLTRRLVQASLFQAMSRLRAVTSSSSKPVVKTRDVRAAIDVLGMRFDRTRYWATAARRHRVDVYTRSRKPYVGREKIYRQGYKLTFDEVEAKLGKRESDTSSGSMSGSDNNVSDEGIDMSLDDDLYTEVSESDRSEANDHLQIAGEPSDASDDEEGSETSSANCDTDSGGDQEDFDHERDRGGRRNLSTGVFEPQEDLYADLFDKKASTIEELRLWEVLKQKPSSSIKEEEMDLLIAPLRERRSPDELQDWHDHCDYYAEWEGTLKPVREFDFERVNSLGQRGRKRRKIMEDAARQEVTGGRQTSSSLSGTPATQMRGPVPEQDAAAVSDESSPDLDLVAGGESQKLRR